MQITANLLDRKAIIEELKTDNSSLRDTIDQMAKKWSRDRATIKNFKTIETRETDRLHKTILDMDVTISDLMDNDRRINGFLDEYRVTVDNRDKTIEELKDGDIEDLHELYDFHEGELEWFNDVISGLKAELGISKGVVTAKDIHIAGLKDELSARKKDSEVLKKVVDVANRWSEVRIDSRPAMNQIAYIVKDYLDAPEGPPETPIDETQDITVTFAFLELP